MKNQSTSFLDNLDKIKALDSTNTLGSIEQIGNQIQEIWELSNVSEKHTSSSYSSIVICGMGGSVLGTDVIKSVFADQLPAPITIVPDYSLPSFVNENTLVIAASYSGNTEETWSALQEAHHKKAQIAGITSGGKIADFLKQHAYPHIIFTETHNPAAIAKMGLGYSIFGQMMLFAQLGLLKIEEKEYHTILQAIANTHLKMSVQISQDTNPAKILAFELYEKTPVLIAAEHLEGSAHVFANQLNENSKTLAEYHIIPELNHHLMEGFAHPAQTKDHLSWVSISSSLYKTENTNRCALTEELLQEKGFEVTKYTPKETTYLGQVFEVIMLASYTSFYLSMIYQADPGPIPTVDWFKKELAKRAK